MRIDFHILAFHRLKRFIFTGRSGISLLPVLLDIVVMSENHPAAAGHFSELL